MPYVSTRNKSRRHVCATPGFFSRVKNHAGLGSVWKCSECQQYWEWTQTSDWAETYREWVGMPCD